MDTDSCVIDGDAFYIRGVILMPTKETSDHFGLGVWVSQVFKGPLSTRRARLKRI